VIWLWVSDDELVARDGLTVADGGLCSFITPIIDGLTELDRQQIAATTKNDGLMVGNDKLFEILGRRTARNFASFVTHLPDSNSELAEDIIQYTVNDWCNILRMYDTTQRNVKLVYNFFNVIGNHFNFRF
jgi:hypothetical protein